VSHQKQGSGDTSPATEHFQCFNISNCYEYINVYNKGGWGLTFPMIKEIIVVLCHSFCFATLNGVLVAVNSEA